MICWLFRKTGQPSHFSRQNKELGVTLLFSGQNIRFPLADRACVINKGRIEFEGTIDELSANEDIKRKYLMI